MRLSVIGAVLVITLSGYGRLRRLPVWQNPSSSQVSDSCKLAAWAAANRGKLPSQFALAESLDVKPQFVGLGKRSLPLASAEEMSYFGVVRVATVIDTTGRVILAAVVGKHLTPRDLGAPSTMEGEAAAERHALALVRPDSFTPPLKGGHPIAALVCLPVRLQHD